MAAIQKTHTISMSPLSLTDHPVEQDYAPVGVDSGKFVLVDETTNSDRRRRIQEAITECNFLLNLVDDEELLLNGVCRLVVGSGGYCKAWISLCDLQPGGARLGSAASGVTQPVTRDYEYMSMENGLIRSGIAIPLRDQLSTFGALMLFSNQGDTFNEDELVLLYRLAANLARFLIARRDDYGSNRKFAGVVANT